MNTKTYTSVREMVMDIHGPEGVKGMDAHAEATKIVEALTLARIDRNLNQRQLAAAMKCSPSKVSRIEDAADADLRLGDIVDYTSALGMRTVLQFDDPSLPAAERIKRNVYAIKDHLDALAALAAQQNDDQQLVAKIHQFYGEVLINFLIRFGDSCRKLPDIVVPETPKPPAVPIARPAPAAQLADPVIS